MDQPNFNHAPSDSEIRNPAAQEAHQQRLWAAEDADDHRSERRLRRKLWKEFMAFSLLAILGVLAVLFFEPSHVRRARGETAAADTPRQPPQHRLGSQGVAE